MYLLFGPGCGHEGALKSKPAQDDPARVAQVDIPFTPCCTVSVHCPHFLVPHHFTTYTVTVRTPQERASASDAKQMSMRLPRMDPPVSAATARP